MMAKHPGVFSGVAIVDTGTDPRDRMRELSRRGVRGFRIVAGAQPPDRWLAGDPMAAMWKCGAEEGLAVCPLMDACFLPALEAMCRKFPETPVVVDHFARIGTDGQLRAQDLENLCGLARFKAVRVKLSAFYALGKKRAPYLDLAPMIRRLLDSFGPERLMWASDSPFQVIEGHRYRDSIELIRQGLDFVTAADRQWLLRRTAEKTFFS
jgi:predicted TIM-barrel fold metal-dependent hydrolase